MSISSKTRASRPVGWSYKTCGMNGPHRTPSSAVYWSVFRVGGLDPHGPYTGASEKYRSTPIHLFRAPRESRIDWQASGTVMILARAPPVSARCAGAVTVVARLGSRAGCLPTQSHGPLESAVRRRTRRVPCKHAGKFYLLWTLEMAFHALDRHHLAILDALSFQNLHGQRCARRSRQLTTRFARSCL
jgi:hypothetical protein